MLTCFILGLKSLVIHCLLTSITMIQLKLHDVLASICLHQLQLSGMTKPNFLGLKFSNDVNSV